MESVNRHVLLDFDLSVVLNADLHIAARFNDHSLIYKADVVELSELDPCILVILILHFAQCLLAVHVVQFGITFLCDLLHL